MDPRVPKGHGIANGGGVTLEVDFGRAEDLGGVFVVVMIALSSVVAAWEAIDRLLHPRAVSHLWVVAAAAVVGFAGNEVVARYRIVVGRRIGGVRSRPHHFYDRGGGFEPVLFTPG